MPRPARGKAPPGRPVHFADTNVLLRFLIADDPPKPARAAALMERGAERIIVTEEVLTETVWTLESFCKVPRNTIGEKLAARSAVRQIPVYTFDEKDFKKLGVDWEKP